MDNEQEEWMVGLTDEQRAAVERLQAAHHPPDLTSPNTVMASSRSSHAASAKQPNVPPPYPAETAEGVMARVQERILNLAAHRRQADAERRAERRAAGSCEDCGDSGLTDEGGYCNCVAGDHRRERDDQVRRTQQASRIQQALTSGGVPRRYLDLTLDGWPGYSEYGEVVLPLVNEWLACCVANGWWLALSGPPQRGKTSLAAAACRELLTREWERGNTAFSIAWCRPDPLQQRLQANAYRDEADVLAPLYAANSLLVIDDLGETGGPVDRKLAMALKHRWEQQLPAIVTTMLTIDDLELRYGGQSEVTGVGLAVGESISWRLAAATDDKRYFISLG